MHKLAFILILCLSLTGFTYSRGRGGERGRPGARHGGVAPRGHGNGHVERPVHFRLPPTPRGGWRGNPYYWENRNYFVWAWGPWAPWWGWPNHYGWTLGLYYYVPEGLRCYADNQDVAGLWGGKEYYNSSEDAINSALGYCENDQRVIESNNQRNCVIRYCAQW